MESSINSGLFFTGLKVFKPFSKKKLNKNYNV